MGVANTTSSANWSRPQLATTAKAAFASLLRHFATTQKSVQLVPATIVETVIEVILGCGMAEPPEVSQQLACELGLDGCERLTLTRGDERGGAIAPAISAREKRTPKTGRK